MAQSDKFTILHTSVYKKRHKWNLTNVYVLAAFNPMGAGHNYSCF